jgi:hypothetical protein
MEVLCSRVLGVLGRVSLEVGFTNFWLKGLGILKHETHVFDIPNIPTIQRFIESSVSKKSKTHVCDLRDILAMNSGAINKKRKHISNKPRLRRYNLLHLLYQGQEECLGNFGILLDKEWVLVEVREKELLEQL